MIILDKKLKGIYFLYYDLGYEQYLNTDIFILKHPLGGETKYACGKITKIFNNFEYEHSIDTNSRSSCSPIIFRESLKVIGINISKEII